MLKLSITKIIWYSSGSSEPQIKWRANVVREAWFNYHASEYMAIHY